MDPNGKGFDEDLERGSQGSYVTSHTAGTVGDENDLGCLRAKGEVRDDRRHNSTLVGNFRMGFQQCARIAGILSADLKNEVLVKSGATECEGGRCVSWVVVIVSGFRHTPYRDRNRVRRRLNLLNSRVLVHLNVNNNLESIFVSHGTKERSRI